MSSATRLLVVTLLSLCLPGGHTEAITTCAAGMGLMQRATACFGLANLPTLREVWRRRHHPAMQRPSNSGPNGEKILNVAGYRFVEIPENELATRRGHLSAMLRRYGVKGTVLLSHEGINLFLAAPAPALRRVLAELRAGHGLQGGEIKFSWSNEQPFKRTKVKLKREIIRMNSPTVRPGVEGRAPSVDPGTLRRWLDRGVDDEGREVVMFDTRNDYELEYGSFAKALDLNISTFSQLPKAVEPLAEQLADKTVVSFCTGGIRCEKAAIYMRQTLALDKVYQLQGGILGYFEQVGGKHYEGGCFVFDSRGVLDPKLRVCRPEGFKLRDRLPKVSGGLV